MLKLKGRKVLITGAGGFIGSHLTERLLDAGCSVRAFVRYNSRRDIGMLTYLPERKLKNIDIISADLRDYNAVEEAVKDTEIVFHLGALIAIPYSYAHPREVVETNVIGTLNVLMACRNNGKIKKIIHTSTSETYGTALTVPITEKHPLQAQSPYSASKIGADKLAESFFDSYNLPVATIRPFNTYGPRQSFRAVVPTIISQALIKNSIELGSLTPRRDFTYVQDTVEGFIKIAEWGRSIGRVINIGSNHEISVGDVVKKIIKIIGKDVTVVQNAKRIRPKLSEVRLLKADNHLAKRLIGWEPKIKLNDGLKMTVEWFKDNIDDIKKKQQIGDYVI